MRKAQIGIVGAGPVGLTLALALSMLGIRVRIFDKKESAVAESRAMTIQPRTLEVLEPLGVVPTIVENGVKVSRINYYRRGRRVSQLSLDSLPTAFPFMLQLPQYKIESAILAFLHLNEVHIERGARVVTVDQNEESVTIQYQSSHHPSGLANFDYLIGCDGAYSTVREQLGIEFEGHPYVDDFIMADVDIRNSSLAPLERHIFLGDGTYFVIMPSGDAFHRLVTIRKTGSSKRGVPDLAEFEEALRKLGGPELQFCNPRWLTNFYPRRAIAERLRQSRVFLAGDAAHVHTPIGAQGLNTGVQDAINLAWKLGYVSQGKVDASILETFHAERHLIAQQLLQNTDQATRRITEASPLGRIRERARWHIQRLPALQRKFAQTNAQLTVSYRALRGDDDLGGGSFSGRVRIGDRAPLLVKAAPLCYQLLIFAGNANSYTLRKLCDLGELAHTISDGAVVSWTIGRSAQCAWQDSNKSIHRMYGAKAPALALVRPDGYIAALLPALRNSLTSSLQKIFIKGPLI